MLPFTTYNIPETLYSKTPQSGKWLILIVDQPISVEHTSLLEKISLALKAEFDQDVFCFHYQPSQVLTLMDVVGSETKLIISFGIAPSALGYWIDLSVPGIHFLESNTFILTLALDSLSSNANAKKELWKSMQLFLEQK